MKARLSWRDFNRGQSGFKVYRDTQPLDPQALPAAHATLGPTVREYVDDPVLEGVTYHYIVSAVVDGVEYYAPEQQITPQAPQMGTLWANGENGFWHDFSDTTTTYQDELLSTAAGVGDPLGGVGDKSGNGNHATQATGSRRPVLSETGGKYWAQFNGTSTGLNQPFPMSPQGAIRWFAAVIQRETDGNAAYIAHGEGTKNTRGDAGFTFLVKVGTTPVDEISAGGGPNFEDNTWPTTTAVQRVQVAFDKNTGQGYMRRDGTDYPLAVGTNYTDGQITTIGYRTPSSPSVFLKGKVYAIMAGDRMTTPAERDMIDQYMASLVP